MPMCEEPPQSLCPKCLAWQIDLDGFGVQFCEACKFCQHPSQSGKDGHWVCNLCGKQLEKLKPLNGNTAEQAKTGTT